MKFELPQLPYSYDALEPYIDARTMEVHHTKHHQTYVNKLNEALDKHPAALKALGGKPEMVMLEELLSDLNSIPEGIRTAIRNHGGGHFNHSIFWQVMCPSTSSLRGPVGALAETITLSFGDIAKFKDGFNKAAVGVFGSGWAWLVVANGKEQMANGRAEKKLEIITTPNQDAPLAIGYKPILGLDVWEHAYYLKYRNRRQEYIDAWWNIVNWAEAESRYTRHIST